MSVFLLVSICALASGQEENPSDPAQAYNIAARAIAEKDWDKGLTVVNGIIEDYKEGAKTRFGPVFGHFYYLRGLLEIGKEQYDAAKESFRICYEDYESLPLGTKLPDSDRIADPNIFRYASLVQWANVEMHQEMYAEAAERYRKALDEGKDDPNVNYIYVRVNLGRCLVKAGKLEEGFSLISPALVSQTASEGLKQVIFMILAEDWSPEMELPPVREFIDSYRKIVSQDLAEDRFERNPRFQALAQEAFEDNDPVRALAWYSLMIDPLERIPVVDEEITELKEREVAPELEEKKAKFLADLQKQRGAITEQSRQLLNGSGSAYFQMKNFSAAYVVFARLSDEVPEDYENRPLFLHNAVASAARIGKWKEAYHYGKIFLDAYPDDPLMPAVSRVLVEIIFLRGQYEEAYTISGDVRGDMEKGSEIRDIPDFVFGASAFHLEKMEESEEALEAYLADYPEGQRREVVEYYLGLAKVRLFKWEEAAEVLNRFIETYKTSAMLPDALYHCALSEFMLDLFEPALAKVERVISEFGDSQAIARSWNLKGDIFATEGQNLEDVETCYLKGKELADNMAGEEETAAYSLWQLLIHTSDANLWDKASGHLAEFQEKHAESVYKLDVLVASLPVLVEMDRVNEGLEGLRAAVEEYGDQATSPQLAEMFGSYLEFIKDNFPMEESKAELEAGRDKAFKVPALRGWYIVGLVDLLSNGQEDGKMTEAQNQNFYMLDNGFEPSLQSNWVIVQLARWHAEFRKDPERARQLYDYIIEERPGTANYNYALLDTAQLLARSESEEDQAEAMTRFEKVLNEIPDEELRELSVLGIARLHSQHKRFPEAQSFWEQYLENREWTVSRPEANYEYARCFDEQGQTNEALKIYVSVYANFPGHLDWSTRAYVRTALILREQGEELKSLLVLQDMLKRMGHHKHPVIDQAKKLFVKWRDEYQPEPEK